MSKKRVALALSGGVDSAVSAVLLKEQGYEVVCFFMKFWSEAISDERMNSCCNIEAYHSAENLAKQLNIPIYTLNFKEKFKDSVVNLFLRSYAAGITPNPCIQCNQFIKFGEFLKKAKQLDFDYIATGHYAQIEKKDKLYYLKKGVDKKKDQSYFLYRINQEILKHTIFPVGNLKKTKVRVIAKDNGLKIHSKKDSQEICFVSNDDIKGFLQRNIKLTPGKIIDIDSKKELGQHQGLEVFTIGQCLLFFQG
jgi:tRNA-specific 2-thiouridylase